MRGVLKSSERYTEILELERYTEIFGSLKVGGILKSTKRHTENAIETLESQVY